MKLGPLLFPAAAFVIIAAASLAVFPPSAFGSSVFYLSAGFIIIAYSLAGLCAGEKKAWQYLGLALKGQDALKLILYGIILYIACMAATFGLSAAMYLLGILDSEAVTQKIGMLPAAALVAAFTIAPLGEELLFRGFFLRWLADKLAKAPGKNAWLASALVTSLIFSVMHASYGSLAELVVAFIVGFMLAYSVKKANSLVPAIIAHSLFNLTSVISVVFF